MRKIVFLITHILYLLHFLVAAVFLNLFFYQSIPPQVPISRTPTFLCQILHQLYFQDRYLRNQIQVLVCLYNR